MQRKFGIAMLLTGALAMVIVLIQAFRETPSWTLGMAIAFLSAGSALLAWAPLRKVEAACRCGTQLDLGFAFCHSCGRDKASIA